MSDSVLEKFVTNPLRERLLADHHDELESGDAHGAFGFLRGPRERAIMLELRKKTGDVRAIGYAWLQRMEFDPSGSITLLGAGEEVRILGRNLNSGLGSNLPLFQGLVRQRVLWVQEADVGTSLQAGKDDTVIERIEW
jgi:hypothetical protein